MEITPDITEKAFESMPPELRKATREINVSAKVHEIAQKYKLHMDVEGDVVSEVWYVILGLSEAEGLGKKLSTRVIIPGVDINTFITEINETIFLPIRQKMMEYYEENADELDEEEVYAEEPVMERAGVHIETENSIPQAADSLNLSRKLTLEGIENPTPTPDIPLSQAKLEAPHSIPPETTDHSISALSPSSPSIPPANQKRSIDPYREIPS